MARGRGLSPICGIGFSEELKNPSKDVYGGMILGRKNFIGSTSTVERYRQKGGVLPKGSSGLGSRSRRYRCPGRVYFGIPEATILTTLPELCRSLPEAYGSVQPADRRLFRKHHLLCGNEDSKQVGCAYERGTKSEERSGKTGKGVVHCQGPLSPLLWRSSNASLSAAVANDPIRQRQCAYRSRLAAPGYPYPSGGKRCVGTTLQFLSHSLKTCVYPLRVDMLDVTRQGAGRPFPLFEATVDRAHRRLRASMT